MDFKRFYFGLYIFGGGEIMPKRDKRLEIRLSAMELYQIKKYFGKESISTYVRNHLLEISSECSVDTTKEEDIFEMFRYYISQDETANEIFEKFIKKMDLGELADIEEEEEENMVWFGGKKITYSELRRLEDEERKKNG